MTRTSLAVSVFPGTQTLPIFAAQALGSFERRGLDLTLAPAPNSDDQRSGLAAGRYQIAHGAADQAVAMVGAGADAVIVAGGDDGFNRLFVQPDIDSLAELRGRVLAADVADTGWSFVLYRMLRLVGLTPGDYAVRAVGAPFRRFEAMRDDPAVAAAILNPPFAIHARRAGLKDMGPVVDTVGPYQGTAPYAMRRWADDNAEVLTAYLAALIEGVRLILDPAHCDAAVRLTAERLKLADDIAAEVYAAAFDPVRGLAADAAFDDEGFANALGMRAEFTRASLAPPSSYVDLTWHRGALQVL